METLEDILNEMRRGMIPKHRHDRELLQNFADRIEKAARRGRTNAYMNGLREGIEDFVAKTRGAMTRIMKTYGIKEENKQ